jgi:hypothetical protein
LGNKASRVIYQSDPNPPSQKVQEKIHGSKGNTLGEEIRRAANESFCSRIDGCFLEENGEAVILKSEGRVFWDGEYR